MVIRVRNHFVRLFRRGIWFACRYVALDEARLSKMAVGSSYASDVCIWRALVMRSAAMSDPKIEELIAHETDEAA